LGIKDKVYFLEQRHSPFQGLSGSQLYLMGSLYEGFPNAVIEANALGMPALAIAAPGGIAEIITNGQNGFIAADEKDFIDKITTAMQHTFDRKRISDGTIQKYSVTKMTNAVLQLFSRLYNDKKENN
jgi:glycosyltransferase involved in cell wall biosynthesis